MSLPFPRPIRLEDRDGFTFLLSEEGSLAGGCKAFAILGVELVAN